MSEQDLQPVLLNDFRAQWQRFGNRVLDAVAHVGRSGWLILGEEVAAFEEALARAWGLPFAVGCASGLDAIEIALRCAGLQPGQKVLTTPLSAFATTLAIVRAGGEPVFVDVDPSGQIDLDACDAVLADDPDLRFMLPVHLYGHALELARLAALRDRYSLRIVEDCAQAIGARSGEMPVGSVGDYAATSFYPTKNLGAMGDGGALLTGCEPGAEAARVLRDYGQAGKLEHAELGLNSRLDELQAAILRRVFLPELDAAQERRREIAGRYRAEIVHDGLRAVPLPEQSASVWHLYPVLVREGRDALRDHLAAQRIATGVHYPRLIPDQKALAGRLNRAVPPLPRADSFARSELSLPIHPHLTERDVDRVIEACNEWRR